MSDLQYFIRDGAESDALAIADLSAQLGYPAGADQVAARLQNLLRGPDDAVLVACAPGGKIVGWIHVFVARRVESAPFAELGGLVVDEAHRKRGCGGLLVDAAVAWARERGAGKLRIRSRVERENAHSVYEHLGFARTKQQHVFDKELGA